MPALSWAGMGRGAGGLSSLGIGFYSPYGEQK